MALANIERSYIPAFENNNYNSYSGETAILATMHGKEKALAEPFNNLLDLRINVCNGLDTDRLGTFSGEIARKSSMIDTAVSKARMGMDSAGCSIGIATEGSFGPDPVVPFITLHTEVLVFIDDRLGIQVTEFIKTHETVFGSTQAFPGEPLDTFIEQACFPAHGLIVKPNKSTYLKKMFHGTPIFKGITTREELFECVEHAASASADGQAHIETDMRAHLNPTRMGVITTLGEKMAAKLLRHCPSCHTPGWGPVHRKQGLPCQLCKFPTSMTLHEIYGCCRCTYQKEFPRQDGKAFADPTYCNFCNP